MAINKEIWIKDFQANLYDVQEWYSVGKNHSEYVLNSVVHVPNAIASATPTKITNSTSLPVATVRQTFDDLTYSIAMIATPPTFVTNIDASEASFDTRSALMKDAVDFLKQAISIEIADMWAPETAENCGLTTGTATRSNIYGNTSIKKLTFQDILTAKAKLIRNTKNVNLDKLFIVVDAVMYNDIVAMTEFIGKSTIVGDTAAIKGLVGEVAGLKVIVRALGLPYISQFVKESVDYTDNHAATAFSAALLFAGDYVSYAYGTMENGGIQMGVLPYAPGYYSDILQGHTRVGGSPLYKAVDLNATTGVDTIKGVYAIVEAK